MGVRFDVTRQSYFERVRVLLLFDAYRSLVIFLGGVQVVAVHGIGLAVDHCRNGHGAFGRGQPEVLRTA
ncbi:hypothetical protein ACINB_24240 [Acidovorax sp. NB1]|nr:hypothetical protein ACINB_24240 [Acidovorax sp. NB1]